MVITAIINGRLLDCVGDEPLENATIVIEDGMIRDIYSGKKRLPSKAVVIDAKGKTIMPGLTDAHAHPGITKVDIGTIYNDPPLLTALIIKRNLEAILQAGFTTIRSMGGDHWYMKKAIEDGLIKGPRLLRAGALLTITGGHADENAYGEQVFHRDISRLVNLRRICDGIDDCRKAAREQLRGGADHVKVCGVSGGCGGPNDQAWHLQFSEAELRAIVEEAEDRGSYVGAHCENDKAIRRALSCGVRTIEHAAFLTEETALMLKERGTYVVATLAAPWWIMQKGREEAPDWFFHKIICPMGIPGTGTLLDGIMAGAEVSYRVGLKVGSGADYFADMCGGEGMELKLKTECGFTPYEAIKSATIVNAEIFRLEDKIGSIEVGKWADIIIVDGYPDEDANLLSEPANVKLVMKKGDIFKKTL